MTIGVGICLSSPLSKSPNIFLNMMVCWHELEQDLPLSVPMLQRTLVMEISWQLQNEPLKEQSTPEENIEPYLYIVTYM